MRGSAEKRHDAKVATGFVYLMKSGPHYKIGPNCLVQRHVRCPERFQIRRFRPEEGRSRANAGESPMVSLAFVAVKLKLEVRGSGAASAARHCIFIFPPYS